MFECAVITSGGVIHKAGVIQIRLLTFVSVTKRSLVIKKKSDDIVLLKMKLYIEC